MAYEHGFVVKNQEELEGLMGPIGSDGWPNKNDEWADSFTSDMMEYIGEPFFGKPYVFLNKEEEGGASNVRAWGGTSIPDGFTNSSGVRSRS